MRLRDIPLDAPTTERHLPSVLNRTHCDRHFVGLHTPCFEVELLNGRGKLPGICNTRARKAGMVGHINPSSLDRSIGRTRG